ncbi:MAG TPA: imidazole glycerol phosphate synthase subunit HisH [Allosphingosinicella sp.]|nr:imidazole glycerol phosphate synthase subunit HisH [Allosphingosinicella sp.]
MTFSDRLVGIVDYRAGNIHSIENAFETLGARVTFVRQEADIASVTHLVLPGVGAFGHCAEKLQATGLVAPLHRAVFDERRPLLGICVGMQLLADHGEEAGGHDGLGWLGGTVRAMTAPTPAIRIPHVGWNDVRFEEDFGGFSVGDAPDFYFDHSFAYREPRDGRVIGSCDHGGRFAAIVGAGNVVAVQFHPEKSQSSGMRFLTGFLAM